MSNTITNVLPTLLAQGLRALRQNAVMPRLVNRSYENLAANPGNVINVPIPSAITARSITPGVTQATNQDFSPATVAVTLDHWYEATFQLSDNDLVSVMSGTIPMQASEAIKALANDVDEYILGKHTTIYSLTGASRGTGAFNTSLTDAANARKKLNQTLTPPDSRRAVIDANSEANFGLNSTVMGADTRGSTEGLIEATIGRKFGIDWYMDQNISTFVPGTAWASGFTAPNGGVVAASTLDIVNATATGNLKVGDIFYLTADGNQYNYVLSAAATVVATTTLAITFTPALKTTVATGATLVVVSGTYAVNLAFHRDAFAFASRPLMDIQGYGSQIVSEVDPVSGIALRLEVSRQYRQTTFAYDILCGANCVRPALACKIAG